MVFPRRPALVALLGLAAALPAQASADGLHRPSPDWRDQVLYQVLTDRFDNGDPRNDDQGAGEFDPSRPDRYSGGDLAGVRRRLDYLQGLGVTGLWLTPWVSHQWLDGAYAGYHGYWPSDFMQVDPHQGTLAELQALSRDLHGRDMVLVQDVVVNHMGDYFDLGPAPDRADPGRSWRANAASRPTPAPTQPPFDLNDPRRAADRAAAIYHWTPRVRDFNDPDQLLNHQMAGLDDLNTENPVVQRALRASYGHWIREAGVDAFRIDTAFYVPPDFFADFLRAPDAEAPGILEVARRTGRRDFHVFGEGFAIDRAFEDSQARRIEAYVRAADGTPRLPGMLNFPLYGALNEVLGGGRPPAELGDRITRTMRVHADPHRLVNFVDNHDVDRFLTVGDARALAQALLAMFTLPGIPVIYQGTEQGFRLQRAAMFAAGWGSGGRDHFDPGAPLYRTIAGLSALRRAERVLSRGWPTVLHADGAGRGVLVWRMDGRGSETADTPLLVALNTADGERLVERPALPAGLRLQPVYGLDGPPPALTVDGATPLRLPARAAMVWRLVPGDAPPAGPTPMLDALPAAPVTDALVLRGQAASGAVLRRVVDGALEGPVFRADDRGRFEAHVDTAAMIDPAIAHRVAVLDEARGAVSEPATFQVQRHWRLLADVDDPAGDDHGPDGRTTYPADPGWRDVHPADLRRVRAWGSGGALRLELTLQGLTRAWNPPNGFDHVAFTVFVELPDTPGGARVMPGQDGLLPGDLRWHRRLRLHGWSNALFDPAGATATDEGRPVGPTPTLAVDAAARTLTLTLPPAGLGNRADLSGVRLWVTTWDWDGGYRALQAEAGPHQFGGPPGTPRVMDASAVIRLP